MLMLQSPMHSTQQHSGLQVDKLCQKNYCWKVFGKIIDFIPIRKTVFIYQLNCTLIEFQTTFHKAKNMAKKDIFVLHYLRLVHDTIGSSSLCKERRKKSFLTLENNVRTHFINSTWYTAFVNWQLGLTFGLFFKKGVPSLESNY